MSIQSNCVSSETYEKLHWRIARYVNERCSQILEIVRCTEKTRNRRLIVSKAWHEKSNSCQSGINAYEIERRGQTTAGLFDVSCDSGTMKRELARIQTTVPVVVA